jgi:hypothetical protein
MWFIYFHQWQQFNVCIHGSILNFFAGKPSCNISIMLLVDGGFSIAMEMIAGNHTNDRFLGMVK